MSTGARPRSKLSKRQEEVQRGSGNVFADLGVPESQEYLAKAELARRICEIIGQQKLTQSEAAAKLSIDQPKISALLRGKLEGFSSDRLFRFLNALGRDVEIVIRPAKGHKRLAQTRVRRAS